MGGVNRAEIIFKNECFHVEGAGESSICFPAYSDPNATIEGHINLMIEDEIDYSYMKVELIGEMGIKIFIFYAIIY